jgi:hypothetical protein
MKMTRVRSSNLASVGWENGTLHVQFRDGRTYAYEAVPPETAKSLTEASSPGKFFEAHIRGRYDNSRL